MGNVFLLLSRLGFFREYKSSLKTLWRTDALHHCNRLLVCLNSKFDEFKEFGWVRIKKNHANFLQCLKFFSNIK